MSKKKEPADFTTRVLLSAVVDINALTETVERLRVQVFALAHEHNIPIPAALS